MSEQIKKEAIGNLFDLLISYKMPNGTTDKELAEFMETTISQAVQHENKRMIDVIKQFDGYDCGKTGCKDQVKSILKALEGK